MAISESRTVDGVRREWWDDETDLHHVVEADGVTPASGYPEPYGPLDFEAKADRVARSLEKANYATNVEALRNGLSIVSSAIATVSDLADSTSGNTKVFAENLEIALRGVRRLARIISGDLSAAD